MPLHDELHQLSRQLLGSEEEPPSQAAIRRCVSTAYYAVFHLLAFEMQQELGGNKPERELLRTVTARSLEHGSMKKLCKEFTKDTPSSDVLKDLWKQHGLSSNSNIAFFSRVFIDLQEMRHTADYDVSHQISRAKAEEAYVNCIKAFLSWKTIKLGEHEIYHLFLTLLPLWPTLARR